MAHYDAFLRQLRAACATHLVLPLALSAALLVSTAGGVLAAELAVVTAARGVAAEGEGGPREQPQSRGRAGASVPPGTNPEAARKAYATLLFQEINVRRDRAASPRYQFMAEAGNEAVDAYLRDLLPAMLERRTCFHGNDMPGMRAGWDYLGDVGIAESKVGGEVLGCPDVNAGGFWTPPGIADGWWKSPSHWRTLYGDTRPKGLACGVDVPIKGGSAYETVACITLLGE